MIHIIQISYKKNYLLQQAKIINYIILKLKP